MNRANAPLPLLPLILDRVPPGLRQALAQEGVPVRNRIEGAPEGRFVLFDSRSGPCRWIVPGQVALDVHRLRRRAFDPWSALDDDTARPHCWTVGPHAIVEEIARVDKRAVREAALADLRAEIESLGGAWIRVAAYPFPCRSALNFRLDYDQYDPSGFAATLGAVETQADCTSHFVCGASYQRQPEALARLRGLDVGSHGYWHHVYRTQDENLRNLRRGIQVLHAARIVPSGFVAPHGRFNPALLGAMEQLGITHSSEFGLAYDELPYFPSASPVLQIPIHPVCLELFLEAARRQHADEQAAVAVALDYFAAAAREKYRAGEPLFFYGHPSAASGRVLGLLAQTAAEFGAVWRTTLTEFGAWWRVRGGVRLTVSFDGEQFAVCAEGIPSEYRVGIEYCHGRLVALMPLDGPRVEFSPTALAYEPRSAQPAFRPVRVDRPQGLRAHLKRLIDWERVTPVEEITLSNWRNWAKRALRRWN